MNTLLFLSLFLLCFPDTIGLLCYKCRYAHNSACLSGQGTCLAPKHGSCSTISYYKEGRHLYSQQMCKHNCYEDQYTYRDELNVTLCCNRNLCNIY
ncbi:prostate and testis expressed protein 4 [Dipodomys merriami]|uniref:prostate and testis expressed protein 4 n=1 Tax=Dipodomys merriami TaxID=94247 RepID=UPI003855FFAC